MKIMIVGSLAGALGQAGRIAISRGARLEQADSASAAFIALRADSGIELVFCDLGQDIVGLLAALANERINVPVVACGQSASANDAVAAIRAGARDFLPLPPDPDLIAAMLESIGGEHHVLVIGDPVMQALVRRAEQIAPTEASVLLTGPSGTGKEVLARHIHQRSRRNGAAFVAVNCAAIPENLLESELFGHEKGAFSGATGRRIGKFEAADKGTLLLDEISEMDVRLQAKLLRVLQEREIDRLGGSAPVKVNVRIIATSNRDLPAEIERGQFREDLYFRLNVVNLRLPSLRERPGDIPVLAAHFARHYADLNALPRRRLSEDALDRLVRHHWRGNVRELENTIHRAVLLAGGEVIDTDAIELSATGPGASAAAASLPPVGAGHAGDATTDASTAEAGAIAGLVGRRMDDVERDLILGTLNRTLGNRTHAATILGISIRALRNKLRDYAREGAHVPPPTVGVAA